MHQVVLLNGPPGCGKDTVASHLVPYIKFRHLKFAAPIKRMVAALLDIDISTLEKIKDTQHRTLKYYPVGAINPVHDTPRALLIALSEDLLKKRYGDGFFGQVLANDIRNTSDQLVIVSDSGFESEFFPIRDEVGRINCRIIRIHRPGKTFDGDSRAYLPDGLVRTLDIHNDGSVHDLTMRVLRVIIREFNTPLLREPDWIKL